MRKLIFILLAFVSITAYGQKKQTIKELVVTDSLTIKAGNPAANKIAVSIDGNGRMRWVYLSDFQDSINTGIYDTIMVSLLRIRDSVMAADGNILSVAQDSSVVGCFTCDTIQYLLGSVDYSPWDTIIDGADTFIVQKNLDYNVGIGTSTLSAKLHVNQQIAEPALVIQQNANADALTVIYYDGIGNDGHITTGSWFMASGTGHSEFNYDSYVSFQNNNSSGVGIGTATPTEKLHVAGTSLFTDSLTYQDDSQGAGKLLTSDALGNATWQDPLTVLDALPEYADDTAAGTSVKWYLNTTDWRVTRNQTYVEP